MACFLYQSSLFSIPSPKFISERGGEVGSNGLILDKNGHLVLCQHGDRRMAKMITDLSNPQSKFKTIIDKYEGKRFNSPNDAVYDSQGIYILRTHRMV